MPVIVAAFLTPKPSAAATTDAAQPSASDLFEQGKTLLRAGDWLGACEKFSQSHTLLPSVSTMVKMARCSEHQGDLKKALLQYRDALQLNRQLVQSVSRQAELESTIIAELKDLEPRVPRLRLRIVPRPSGLQVVIDGQRISLDAIEQPVALSPGDHELVVTAPGYRTEHIVRTLVERASVDVDVAMTQELGQPSLEPTRGSGFSQSSPTPSLGLSTSAAHDSSPIDRGAAGDWQRNVAWVLGGAGATSLAIAGYFGIRTLKLVHDARESGDCDAAMTKCSGNGWNDLVQARHSQVLGFVFAGAGAALAGTGIVLYLTAARDTRQKAAMATGPRRLAMGVGLNGANIGGYW